MSLRLRCPVIHLNEYSQAGLISPAVTMVTNLSYGRVGHVTFTWLMSLIGIHVC